MPNISLRVVLSQSDIVRFSVKLAGKSKLAKRQFRPQFPYRLAQILADIADLALNGDAFIAFQRILPATKKTSLFPVQSLEKRYVVKMIRGVVRTKGSDIRWNGAPIAHVSTSRLSSCIRFHATDTRRKRAIATRSQ